MLIRNRKKPIAIGARAVIRAGTGHKYWSSFPEHNAKKVEELAAEFYSLVFEPEAFLPLKTLDVPVGGSVSPVDALSLLIETFTISGTKSNTPQGIKDYSDDADGSLTVDVLENALSVIKRITGNAPGSLGLHPAVYFYNERGKYSRFLFLGVLALVTERLRVNDQTFFKKFTKVRKNVESFMLENKSILGIVLQNLSKGQRVNKMRDLFTLLIGETLKGDVVTPERAIEHLGLQGRILDVKAIQEAPKFTDDTKSMVFLQQALKSAIRCEICSGYLDPNKSVSYDHKKPIRDGGTGDLSNAQLSHPYCNTGYKN